MPEGVTNAAKPLVLLVEDEAALATMLRYNLERHGFCVEEAGDGHEALRRLNETTPDLVLLDWMLPGVSGLEVCRQMRRRPQTRDVPVIMVTARTEDQDAVRGLDTGADDFVTKPFAMDALLARMRALLRRAGAAPVKGELIFHDIVMDRSLPVEDRFDATLKLAQLPRNGARNRVRLRCELTGRPRGNYRKFKLSRNMLRELANTGQLPGVVKASW